MRWGNTAEKLQKPTVRFVFAAHRGPPEPHHATCIAIHASTALSAALQQAESQAQASGPEVVAYADQNDLADATNTFLVAPVGYDHIGGKWRFKVALITLQSYRKAMLVAIRAAMKTGERMGRLSSEKALAKKDAKEQELRQALKACVEALIQANEETKLYPGHEGRYVAAITQGQEAMK